MAVAPGKAGRDESAMRPLFLLAVAAAVTTSASAADHRPRAREAGIEFGVLPPGPLNAITDVAGVKVGQVTIIEGSSIRTGVTAILPHGGNLYQDKVPAGFAVANAYGKFMGSTQVKELGEIETPIVLTNTLNVPEAAAGDIEWTLKQPGNEQVRSVNAVVGETNDGYLNDIRARRVKPSDAVTAIETALEGRFRLTLRKDLKLDYPRAETPTHYMTMAMDPDLDQCVVRALRDMIVLLGEKRNLSREDAYTLCSLAADLRVTQTVNGSKGIHCMIAKDVVHG